MDDRRHPASEPDDTEQTYDRLQALSWGFAPTAILHATEGVGLLGWLAEQEPEAHVTAAAAAGALGLHPGVTDKVLRALTGMELLEVSPEGYRMRPGARPLFEEGSELDHGAALRHLGLLAQSWLAGLPEFLRTGQWARPPRGPDGIAAFVEAMRALAVGMAGRLDGALPLAEARDMLDIGGALGTFSIELCHRHPSLRSTVVDLPEVVPLTDAEIARHGLDDRIRTLPGSYLDPELSLPAADLALLANVLHQETAREAAGMVARAAAALRPGGHLAVLEFTLEDDRCHPLSGALFALNMRLFGDTYSEGELAGWMREAGLVDITRHDLSRAKFVILGRRS